jgi:hypothetical protein
MVGADFFGMMAQVLPTIGLVLFLAELPKYSKKELKRMRRGETLRLRTKRWSEIASAILTALTFLSVIYAEMVCLLAAVKGGGTEGAAVFVSLLAGFMLVLIALQTVERALSPFASKGIIALVQVLVILVGTIVITVFAVHIIPPERHDLDWVYGWVLGK